MNPHLSSAAHGSGERAAARVRHQSWCSLCNQAGRQVFAKHGHAIYDCTSCGHRFAGVLPSASHVADVYGDQYFTGGGAGYADYLAEAELLRERGRDYARLIAPWRSAGRLLDVGAAAGLLLQGFIDAGWQGCGLEPNGTMAATAKSRMGLDVRQGTAETLDFGESFDLVSMIQVIAHFTDVNTALRNLARTTSPGGWWLIETWDRNSWTARLTGTHWHEYSPPSVLHWFTRESLTELVDAHGFDVVAGGRPRKRISGAHAKSLLRYKFQGHRLRPIAETALAAIPDRAQIPYPAEDLFWLLCRKRQRHAADVGDKRQRRST